MRHPSLVATRWATVLVALVLAGFGLLEQWGKTTSDTKTPLIENPADFLHRALSLWNPQTSLGELQNQAYGYLFPQGPFFLLAQLAHVPAWIGERAWTVAVILAGCEGARLLARNLGMTPWPAWLAGMAYGLNPHVMAQVGVRSAEVLPGAVLPWVVLPLVLHLTGRLGPRRAVVFSVMAFAFSGAVNGTATGAPLVLVVVLLVWARRRRLVTRRLVTGWFVLLAATSLWWVASLLRLNSYAPPFFDYVEDAKATTSTTGAEASLRGLSNWVNYTFVGSSPGWPAGFDLAYSPWLVLATGLLAAIGVLGLVGWRSPWRTPMVVSAATGLALLVAGHSSPHGSLLAPFLQDLLDGPFALLRNVHKIDPVLRLPLALGVGAAFAQTLEHARPRRRLSVQGLARLLAPWLVAGLTLGMAQPAVAMNLRTPGWTETPAYWRQAAAFLAVAPEPTRGWIVPGSGFGVQTWGWTMDEPFAAVATSEWVTRSQVPLTPPTTIRVLSSLEGLLDTGAGSPYLGTMLERLGIGYVVVRHDLDPTLSEAPISRLTSLALARSNGLRRVAAFGSVGLGPAIEIFRVTDSAGARDVSLTPESDVVTVAGASTDVMQAIGRGLIGAHQAAVVQGDDGWSRPADIVGDSFRNVERDFGRVHDAESNVRTATEPTHSGRVVPDYPGNVGSRRIDAVYDTIRYATASSSQAFPNVIGAVQPENEPSAAFDGDGRTEWRSSYFRRPQGQWVEAVLPQSRAWRRVTVLSPVWDDTIPQVTRWRVVAAGRSRTVEVDPFTGRATVDLGGVRSDRLRIVADRVQGDPESGPAAIAEVRASPFPASRTLVVPDYDLVKKPAFAFSARPETRACIPTLLGPDCDARRARPSEESSGIDRTVTVPADGRWTLTGTAVARSGPATAALLDPIWGRVIMRGSSTFRDDPGVSARMAYDANPGTSWIADPRDPAPTLTIDFATPHVISRLSVSRPAAPAVSPQAAVLRSEGEVRRITLSQWGTFRPLKTRHLEITFTNDTRRGAPIGLGDLSLGPGDVSVALDGAATSGSVCGYGPPLRVDGRTYRSRVSGPLGNIASGGPLEIVPCDGEVRLTAGSHRVRIVSTDQFQPVDVTLLPQPAQVSPVSRSARDVHVVSSEASRQTVRVGAGPASLLGTGRNINAGWVAELDGKRLPVQRIDGWAQGWRVPAGAAGTIEIRYQPERAYVAVLLGGLALDALVFLLAMVLLLRTRLRPGAPPDAAARRDEQATGRRPLLRAPRLALALAGALVLGVLVSGAAALAAAAVLAATVWLRWSPRVVAAVLLGAAAVVAAATLAGGPAQQIPAADLLAATGFLVALGELPWGDPRPRRRTRRA